MRPRVLAAVRVLAAAGAVALLAACDNPPPADVPVPARSTSIRPSSQGAPTSAPPALSVTPAVTGSSGFSEETAAPCAGRPSADQVLSVVRRSMHMPANANLTVRTGPLCAGTWQYSVVVQPEVDPLQVVTRGVPGSLTLVTAGTDVCTADVKAAAPPGITLAAHC